MKQSKPSHMKDYEAHDDARHLIESQKIMADSKRHGKAKKAMDEQAAEAKSTLLHVKAAKGLKKAFAEKGAC